MVLKTLSLKENMTWTLAGTVIYSFTQWLLLIVIAKLGTPEMVGQYALGLAVTAPVVMLTDMKLRTALVTDAKASFGFEHYLGTRIISVGLSLLLFLLVIFIGIYEKSTGIIILLIGISKISESISDIFHGQLQKNERMDLITVSDILKGVLMVIVFTIILYVTGSLIIAIIGQLMVWTAVLLFFDCIVTRHYTSIKASFHLPKIKGLVKLTIPLGFMALLTSLNTNIPSYLVEYFLGKEELGYFTALLYILLSGNRVVNSFRQPAAPRLAILYEQKNTKGYWKLMSILLAMGFFIGAVGILVASLFGNLLLSILYTPSYAVYSGLFIAIMVSGIFNYPAMFLSTGMMATRHFKLQPYLAAIWLVVSFIGCCLFIPKFGVYGAAYAVIISSFVKFTSLVFVLLIIFKKGRIPANRNRKESQLIKEVTY